MSCAPRFGRFFSWSLRLPPRKSRPARGRKLADSSRVALILLVLFPFLLLVDTRLAWVAMAAAIALICRKQLAAPRRPVRRSIDDDASI